jgi:hypothetical protein
MVQQRRKRLLLRVWEAPGHYDVCRQHRAYKTPSTSGQLLDVGAGGVRRPPVEREEQRRVERTALEALCGLNWPGLARGLLALQGSMCARVGVCSGADCTGWVSSGPLYVEALRQLVPL